MTAVLSESAQSKGGIMQQQSFVKPALLFGVLSGMASATVLPYAMAINPQAASAALPPFPVLLLVTFLQNTILASLVAFFGLRAAAAVGLGSALHDAHIRASLSRRTLVAMIGIGLFIGLLVWGLDQLFEPWMPELPALADVSILARLGAVLYGGIAEEVLMRLGAMSIIAWLLTKLRIAPHYAVHVGIVAAAVLFGVGHLPAMGAIVPLTMIVIVRTVLLNAIPGIVFGTLYRRFGIEHSMLAHACADIMLVVLIPSMRGM
jgi:hypothetical protein